MNFDINTLTNGQNPFKLLGNFDKEKIKELVNTLGADTVKEINKMIFDVHKTSFEEIDELATRFQLKGDENFIIEMKELFIKSFEKNKELEEYIKELEQANPEIKAITKKQKNNLILKSKLSNKLIDVDIYEGLKLNVGKIKSKNIQVTVKLENKNIELTKTLNHKDKIVFDSICTLYDVGNDVISPAMIYKTMTGYKAKNRPTEKQIKEIEESIEKLRNTRAYIDRTQELKFRNIKGKAIFDSNMLNITRGTFLINNTKTVAYKIESEPTLYRYNKDIKQIVSLPLNVCQAISWNSLEVAYWLINRIELLKTKKNYNTSINLYDLFNDCNINIDDRAKKDRELKKLKNVLDEWKKINYIKNYEFTKTRNKITNLKLIL